MAEQCFIGWRNRIGAATLSGGSWAGLANVKTMAANTAGATPVYAQADATAMANTVIDVDMGAAYSVRTMQLARHNMSADALVKLSLGTTPGGTDVYAGSWVSPWSMTFGAEGVAFVSSDSWWAGVSTTAFLSHPWIAGIILSQSYSARYARIEIDDETISGGVLKVGHVWLGDGLLPAVNRALGARDGWVDTSSYRRTMGGGSLFQHGRRYRRTAFVLDVLTQTEANEVYELTRRQGTVGDVLWLPDINSAATSQRYGFVGVMSRLSEVEYPYPLHRGAAFEIEEIL